MMYGEVYIGEGTMQGRLQDQLKAHESLRLARVTRNRRPSGLVIQARKLLGHPSRLLVVVGARLAQRTLPPCSTTERQLMENGSYRA
jgi:hypothetical protein